MILLGVCMRRWVVFSTLALVASGSFAGSETALSQVPACRHDERATAADNARREQALAVARAINVAQADAFGRSRQYLPLDQLTALPKVPGGFRLRLYTDGNSYIFSLTDQLDGCHYGVFSDERGRLYAQSPQPAQMAH